MGREIERKFLVQGDGWREGAQGVLMRQGYLSRERERTVRVRLAGGRGYLTVKGINEGISRPEISRSGDGASQSGCSRAWAAVMT